MLNYEGGYMGFTFDGRHSSEFGLLVVSDGSRYHQNLSSQFSDSVVQVPGRNGGYYFGTQLGMKDFQINCVYDNMSTHTMHEIQRWLYPNKVGWLIFDETPYKKYLVKLSDVPSFDFIPFDKQENIKSYQIRKEILKGELDISFFSFNEFGYENEEYEVQSITTNELIIQQTIDSGLLPSNYSHEGIFLPHEQVEQIPANYSFEIYNAGNGRAEANFYFTINKEDIGDNNPLEIFNYDDGENYIITNPASIIEKEGYSLSDINKYRIKINSDKKEIWLDGLNNNEVTTSTSINIGGCYNHYFPHINHIKPTDIMIISYLNNDSYNIEPLFYPYSYENSFIPSDKSNSHSFEELKNIWSDYTLLDGNQVTSLNSLINPVFGFYDLQYTSENSLNKLVYLLYPNKFICNKNLYNFVVEYKHTYI